jgi:predicted RNA binding protein with dsRBD fold (UPF0201 family)
MSESEHFSCELLIFLLVRHETLENILFKQKQSSTAREILSRSFVTKRVVLYLHRNALFLRLYMCTLYIKAEESITKGRHSQHDPKY